MEHIALTADHAQRDMTRAGKIKYPGPEDPLLTVSGHGRLDDFVARLGYGLDPPVEVVPSRFPSVDSVKPKVFPGLAWVPPATIFEKRA